MGLKPPFEVNWQTPNPGAKRGRDGSMNRPPLNLAHTADAPAEGRPAVRPYRGIRNIPTGTQ
jgi:hypothetical protein